MGLSEEAQKEIRAAIAIVREDRFEKFARSSVTRHSAPKEEPKEDEIEVKEKSKVDAPPQKEEKEKEVIPPKKDAWWGEIESD